jgi:hypothetical protein
MNKMTKSKIRKLFISPMSEIFGHDQKKFGHKEKFGHVKVKMASKETWPHEQPR